MPDSGAPTSCIAPPVRSGPRSIATSWESNWYTPGFCAPEVRKSGSTVDQRADIFSVAAVWYYFLLRRKFDPKQDLDIQLGRFNDLNKGILRSALHSNPAERPNDLSEFREGITALKSTGFDPQAFRKRCSDIRPDRVSRS
jgi:serine/threonine protein kinase